MLRLSSVLVACALAAPACGDNLEPEPPPPGPVTHGFVSLRADPPRYFRVLASAPDGSYLRESAADTAGGAQIEIDAGDSVTWLIAGPRMAMTIVDAQPGDELIVRMPDDGQPPRWRGEPTALPHSDDGVTYEPTVLPGTSHTIVSSGCATSEWWPAGAPLPLHVCNGDPSTLVAFAMRWQGNSAEEETVALSVARDVRPGAEVHFDAWQEPERRALTVRNVAPGASAFQSLQVFGRRSGEAWGMAHGGPSHSEGTARVAEVPYLPGLGVGWERQVSLVRDPTTSESARDWIDGGAGEAPVSLSLDAATNFLPEVSPTTERLDAQRYRMYWDRATGRGDTGGVELGLEFFSATNTQEPTLTWYAVLPPGSSEFVTPDLSPPLERWRVPADASVRPRLTVVDADWLPWDTYRVGGPAPLPRGQRVRMTSFRSAGWW